MDQDAFGELEREFAEYFGFPCAVAVASGTDAVALALQALGVGPGQKVATVSHTAVATAAAILMAGATPVFLDIEAFNRQTGRHTDRG